MSLSLEKEAENEKNLDIKRKKSTLPAKQTLFPPINNGSILSYSRERMSPSASAAVNKKAVMTVEAAVVLPLFIFAAVCMMYFMEAIRIQSQIGDALNQVSKELAQYAYLVNQSAGDKAQGGLSQTVSNMMSGAYAKNQIIKKVGESRLQSSIVKDGEQGLNFLYSEFLKKEEMIDLYVTYKIQFPFSLFRLPDIVVAQRSRTRGWTGWDASEDNQTDAQMVYITKTGTVYHKSQSCSHIKLSIQTVAGAALPTLRNDGGGKYYPCEKCGKGTAVMGSFYITSTGNRYHTTLGCSGLKRGILSVPVAEVGGRRPCSRCAG